MKMNLNIPKKIRKMKKREHLQWQRDRLKLISTLHLEMLLFLKLLESLTKVKPKEHLLLSPTLAQLLPER